MARQAAHLFAVLAAALGIKFEAYAITFMSAVYKGLVITVQVRCDCVTGLLFHCLLHNQAAGSPNHVPPRADVACVISRPSVM